MSKFLNNIPPQTVTGPGVSAPLGHTRIYVQATASCFVCVSADGTGTDGNAVGATNGHFIPAGGSLLMCDLEPQHRMGVNTGTVYISAVNGVPT